MRTVTYVPEHERLKRNMVEIVERYAQHTGVTVVTALGRVAKMTHLSAIWTGRDIKAGTYDKLVRAFSEAWPEGLEWPDGVERPPHSGRDAA